MVRLQPTIVNTRPQPAQKCDEPLVLRRQLDEFRHGWHTARTDEKQHVIPRRRGCMRNPSVGRDSLQRVVPAAVEVQLNDPLLRVGVMRRRHWPRQHNLLYFVGLWCLDLKAFAKVHVIWRRGDHRARASEQVRWLEDFDSAVLPSARHHLARRQQYRVRVILPLARCFIHFGPHARVWIEKPGRLACRRAAREKDSAIGQRNRVRVDA